MGTLQNGLKAGLRTTWTLGKIIFPITVLVVILQHTPVLPWLIKLVAPFMGIFGLSGEAAIPLVLGNALNLYAGIAGILSLEMTVKEVFIIAVMLSFSHNIFIETGVALKVGVKLWIVLVVRFGLAIMSGIIINLLWKGGGETAQYGMAPQITAVPDGWLEIGLLGVQKASFGVLQLALIVIPLMIFVQLLKDRNYLQKFSEKVGTIYESNWCTTECFNNACRGSSYRPCLWRRRYDSGGTRGWCEQEGRNTGIHLSRCLSRSYRRYTDLYPTGHSYSAITDYQGRNSLRADDHCRVCLETG